MIPIDEQLTVRRERAVDAELAAQLDALFDEGVTWDEEHGRRYLEDPDALLLVARSDGAVCGFLTAYRLQRFDHRRAKVLLSEVGVEGSFRRRGTGQALIEAAMRWAVEVGAGELRVPTEEDNAPARGLSAAMGGREEAGITIYHYDLGR